MRYLIITLAAGFILSPSVMAQGTFNPITRTGNLGNVDPGAVIQPYVETNVPNTYDFIDPKDVGLKNENPSDVINVEKMDVFGQIKVNPENTEANPQAEE
ncbi:MAG: hypothetical protein AB1782_19920 [Cyanobacteriota bacterium]